MENKLVHVYLQFRSGYVPLSLLTCLLRGLVLYCHCVACFRICFVYKFEEEVICLKNPLRFTIATLFRIVFTWRTN